MMKEIYHIYLKKYQIIHTKPDGNERKTRFVGLPWQHVCDVCGLNALRSFFFPKGLWRHPISKTVLSYLFAHDFKNHPSHTCYIVEDKNSLIIDAAKLLEGVVYPNCHVLIGGIYSKASIIDESGHFTNIKPHRKLKDSRDLNKQAEQLKIEYPYVNVSLKTSNKVKDKEIRFRDDFKDRTWKRFRKTQYKCGHINNKINYKFDIEKLRKELIG